MNKHTYCTVRDIAVGGFINREGRLTNQPEVMPHWKAKQVASKDRFYQVNKATAEQVNLDTILECG